VQEERQQSYIVLWKFSNGLEPIVAALRVPSSILAPDRLWCGSWRGVIGFPNDPTPCVCCAHSCRPPNPTCWAVAVGMLVLPPHPRWIIDESFTRQHAHQLESDRMLLAFYIYLEIPLAPAVHTVQHSHIKTHKKRRASEDQDWSAGVDSISSVFQPFDLRHDECAMLIVCVKYISRWKRVGSQIATGRKRKSLITPDDFFRKLDGPNEMGLLPPTDMDRWIYR
jgi:hypothetical protein